MFSLSKDKIILTSLPRSQNGGYDTTKNTKYLGCTDNLIYVATDKTKLGKTQKQAL